MPEGTGYPPFGVRTLVICPLVGQKARMNLLGVIHMANSLAPSASQRWHKWVEEHPVGGLAVIGLIATQLGTYFGYVFPAFGLPTLPWPMYNGALALGINGPNWGSYFDAEFNIVAENAGWLFFSGQSLHFVNGIVFAMLFGIFAHKQIPVKGHVAKGLIYGVVMTIISAGLLVPYAYVAEQGYGLFLFDGPDGWKLPAGILVWHLIYGAFLGLLYQPKDSN